MKVRWLLAAMIASTITGYAQAPERSTLDRGIAGWRWNYQEYALAHFRKAISEEPNNADAYAWLAEALRRVDSMQTAATMARHALALSPCHPQAHTTLADLYNPQHSYWEQANSDSTWLHYMKSVECDPEDGNAWLGIWTEAMRTRRIDIEKKALRTLVSTGFITPGALAYARWMLGSLPPNAILITHGDMDTYPLVALQESEGFRTDVAVINASLLDMNWYAALMTTRHRITGGYSAMAIETLQQDDEDTTGTVGRQVIERWAAAARKGTLARPFTIALGVDLQDVLTDIDNVTLAGQYWIRRPGNQNKPYETKELWKSLRALDPKDFAGRFVSKRDRSPIRRAYAPQVAGGVVALHLMQATTLLLSMGTEGIKEAEKLAPWIAGFSTATGASGAPAPD